ncbi:MAG: hypothetical protein M0R17_14315 [Candidatus Omnitrophica bacterium]|nr:hypothetical protein [Candidatus Omnitrophota bacterium]
MIVYKLRLLIIGLFFVVYAGCPLLLAAEISIPLPADAVKISEKIINAGPVKSTVEIYQSFLSQNRIIAFYKKEMLRAGWAQNKSGLFMREGYTAAITTSPLRNQAGAAQFVVITSKIPDAEEVLAARKAKPDKLEFMPIYPGCIQNFLWDTSMGVSGSYETEDDIGEVIFFYKSAMLRYDWNLYSEVPIKVEEVKYPGYKSDKPATSTSASLRFHRKVGESCVIMITSVSGLEYMLEGEKLVEGAAANSPVKTTILIVYNEQKGIN